jgi:hypothetical protein
MIVLKKLTLLNKIYPEASLGTQRRTMLGNNSRKAGKKVAQAVGFGAAAKIGADVVDTIKENAAPVLQSARETLDSFRNNGSNGSNTGGNTSSTTTTEVVSSGGNTSGNPTITTTTKKVVTIGGDNPTTTTTEVVTKTEPTPLGTSPDVYSWDPIRVLNPEWLATHSPFNVESIVDALLVGLMLFIIALIVIVYVMWGAYYSNTVNSFIIGKKKLPVYHLALISIAVLVGVLTLSLIYVAVFAGIMVEAASLKGLCSDITKLQSEIEEIRTLVEFPSIEKKK